MENKTLRGGYENDWEILLAGQPEAFRGRAMALRHRLTQLHRPILAFSGGVDSSLVAAMLARTHGPQCLLVTADSPSLARRQREVARRVAVELGLPHQWLATQEASDPRYQENPLDRCYYCKSHLYAALRQIAEHYRGATLLSGTNRDDLGDHRPGLRAAAEWGILAPLADVGMTKADVRTLAALLKLSVHDLPAAPCLASRLAYGVPVTRERLARVEAAENLLWEAGFSDVRVRVLAGEIARLEVPPAEVPRLRPGDEGAGSAGKSALTGRIQSLGFSAVVVDPLGLRSGNLNPPTNPKLPHLTVLPVKN